MFKVCSYLTCHTMRCASYTIHLNKCGQHCSSSTYIIVLVNSRWQSKMVVWDTYGTTLLPSNETWRPLQSSCHISFSATLNRICNVAKNGSKRSKDSLLCKANEQSRRETFNDLVQHITWLWMFGWDKNVMRGELWWFGTQFGWIDKLFGYFFNQTPIFKLLCGYVWI